MPKRKSAIFTRKKRHSTTPNPNRSKQLAPSFLPSSARQPQTASKFSDDDDEADELDGQSSLNHPPKKLVSRKRKRLGSSSNPLDLASDAESAAQSSEQDELALAPFPTLKARERLINHAVVKNKWEQLPEASQEKVLAIFAGVERPLLSLNRGEKKKIEAQIVLGQLLKTLARRLPRMPFPPGTKEWAFDLETVLKGNKALEQQLTPAVHSVALLKTEIRKEKERLQVDQVDLDELKKNARDEERIMRKKVTKLHQLLEEPENELEDKSEDIILSDNPAIVTWSKDDELDDSLHLIAQQIRNHLESMENNVLQVDEIAEQISASAAKLDALLYQRLPWDEYEKLPVF